MPKIKSICKVCKKKFEYYLCSHSIREYCSKTCYGKIVSQRNRLNPVRNAGKYKHKKGNKSSRWKGGLSTNKDGYIIEYCPNHPFAIGNPKNYILQHRLIMEKHLCRYLTKEEVVHHINGIKTDNRIENLKLFSCTGKHSKLSHKPNGNEWGEARKKQIQRHLDKLIKRMMKGDFK